ncbi:MAG: SAF domain-containing protein, partial [Steroidobacteraceae bacterium]
MLRGRGALLILSSVFLAMLAAFVATRWMNARAAVLDASKPGLVGVAVAAIEIPFGTQIEARHVSSIQMLAGTQPGDAFADEKQPLGKVAKATILPGELLLKARFV